VSGPERVGIVEGRAWVFDDENINTDLILPSKWANLRTEEEQARLLLLNYRPGWVDQVREGDVVVAGKNFGTGSGRPATRLMHLLGVRALVADTINDLFYRNCVNAALPAMDCAGASRAVKEGDRVRVDVLSGTLEVLRTGEVLRGTPMPPQLLEIVSAGGLVAQLSAGGFI
jgi:3-isopropylmalate/(R)-2-methylmalate dehydratase small subunit